MKRLVPSIGAMFLFGIAAAPACDNPRPVAPLNNGLAGCKEMRKLCAAPAEAFGDPYTACHETGLANLGSKCLDVYDSCVEICQEALMSLGGAGGVGGVGDAGGDGGMGPLLSAGEGGARQ